MKQLMRSAVRSLGAAPLVYAVAITSLGLGIGANAAFFSIASSLISRPLPVREPHDLGMLVREKSTVWPNPVWEHVRDRSTELGGAVAWSLTRFDLAESGESDFVDGLWVSGTYFTMLGVSAIQGRVLTVEDDRLGGGSDGPVAVISHRFWQTRFGGAADVVGRRISVDRARYTVVGVTPPSFFGTNVGRGFDIAVPLGTEPLTRPNSSLLRGLSSWLQIIVRAKPGGTLQSTESALRLMQPTIRDATLPLVTQPAARENHLVEPFKVTPAAGGDSPLREQYRRPLFVLMGIAILVLLVACANVANVLLARAAARGHEFSVRQALGASRRYILRQVLSEAALLSVLGGVLGIAVAVAFSRLLVLQLSTPSSTAFLDLSPDWRVVAAFAITLIVTTLLFGVMPALRALRVDPAFALKFGARATSGRRSGAVSRALVVAQVSLSCILLVSAGVLIGSLLRLQNRPIGLDLERVMVANVNAQRAAVAPADRPAMYERMRLALLDVPGVTHAGVSRIAPLSGSSWQSRVQYGEAAPIEASTNLVSPGWFAAYGTRLLAGRDFDATDRVESPRVAIVNRSLARMLGIERDPVGSTIRLPAGADAGAPVQVVGLVEDAAYRSVHEPLPPAVYVPLLQMRGMESGTSISIRGAAGQTPGNTATIVRALVGVEPAVSVSFISLPRRLDAALARERMLAQLSLVFSVLGLLLAGIGIYGVTAYTVQTRIPEFGIRMAVGATPGVIARLVLVGVGVALGTGTVIGLAASWMVTRALTPLLWQGSADFVTATMASILLLFVAGAAATIVPLRRALTAPPGAVMRAE